MKTTAKILIAGLLAFAACAQAQNFRDPPRTALITGGTIDGTVIGGTTPAAGSFTTLNASSESRLYGGVGIGTPPATGDLAVFTSSENAAWGIRVYNQNVAGAAASANVLFNNNNYNAYLALMGSGYSTSGILRADALILRTDAPGGLNIGTTANYPVRTYVNGSQVIDTTSSGVAVTGTLSATGDVAFGKTITAGGTTGAQTINKTTGRVNFAAAATSLVVTNSVVTNNSIIHCTVNSADVTMYAVQCVPGAGAFTMYPNAAPTAETKVSFTVTN